MINQIIVQIILGVVFLFLSLFVFTYPALYLLRRTSLSLNDFLEEYCLSTVLGICIFTLSAYSLAALNLRFLMWTFPIFGLIIFFKKKFQIFSKSTIFQTAKVKKIFFVVFFIGIIGQVAVNAPSGMFYKDGIYFWSSHGHDGVWHLALMEHMHKNVFPFQNPEYGGQKLQNYHFFVDLLMSEMTRLFPFSNLDVYFRFMPLFFSILLGLSGFILVRAWSKTQVAGIWAMVFSYFGGSFGYMLTIPRNNSLNGETIFWVSQTQSVLGNPPHAAAFIILTVFLFCFYKYLQTQKKHFFWLALLLGGTVIEFKVYAGILILGGLLLVALWKLISQKKGDLMLLFIGTLLLSFGIYYPNSLNSQDFLIWQPWWYIRTMVVASDRLNWLDLELRRQTYIAENNWKRVIQLELTAFFAFLFGNLGMRILGFASIYELVKDKLLKNYFNLFYLAVTFASFVIPVLFLQKGVAWNSIQFNQYFLLLFGYLAAIYVKDIINKVSNTTLKFVVALIIVILAIPTQIGLLWQFYSNLPLSKVTYEELGTLKYLTRISSEDDIILTAPYNEYAKAKYFPPVPIYSWYDTGYVAAFSARSTYLSDQEQVTIIGFDINNLLEERKKAFESDNVEIVNDFLVKSRADYVYLAWDQKFNISEERLNLTLLYKTDNTKLYKVNKKL